MNTTEHYKLKLPEQDDPVDVDVLDENFKTIDTKLHEETTARTKADTDHAAVKGTSGAFGHVKLSDSISGTETVANSVAATPKAVADAKKAADTALATETKARTDKDTELGNKITQEIADRKSADTDLQAKITKETNDRAAAVTAEKTAREAADTALQDKITAEVSARAKADTDHAAVKGTGSAFGHVKLSDATTGTDGVASGVAATPKAVKAVMDYAKGLLAANDAMVFKGTIGTGGTVTALPTSGYQAGWAYKVITAGTYAGVKCEVGDLIIAVKDFATATANTDWTVVQTNIDGAVTGPASATDGHIALFNGATGKTIKDSGKTFPLKTADIATDAITADKIAAGAVGESELAANAVTTAKLADKAISEAKLQAGSVTQAKIKDGAVTTGKIADGAVNGDKIAERTVGLSNLTPGTTANTVLVTVYENNQYETHWRQIDSSMIMDKQVQNSDIKDESIVGSEKLKAKSVTGGRIADKTVGTDQLADKAISETKLQAGSVTQAKIKDGAVTEGKLDTTLRERLNTMTSHISSKTNPHSVTKTQVGLGSADNTSDMNKPVSTAQMNFLFQEEKALAARMLGYDLLYATETQLLLGTMKRVITGGPTVNVVNPAVRCQGEGVYTICNVSGSQITVEYASGSTSNPTYLSLKINNGAQAVINISVGGMSSNYSVNITGPNTFDPVAEVKASLHTHSNKTVLDKVTDAKISAWDRVALQKLPKPPLNLDNYKESGTYWGNVKDSIFSTDITGGPKCFDHIGDITYIKLDVVKLDEGCIIQELTALRPGLDVHNPAKFIRTRVSDGNSFKWSVWQELTTKFWE